MYLPNLSIFPSRKWHVWGIVKVLLLLVLIVRVMTVLDSLLLILIPSVEGVREVLLLGICRCTREIVWVVWWAVLQKVGLTGLTVHFWNSNIFRKKQNVFLSRLKTHTCGIVFRARRELNALASSSPSGASPTPHVQWVRVPVWITRQKFGSDDIPGSSGSRVRRGWGTRRRRIGGRGAALGVSSVQLVGLEDVAGCEGMRAGARGVLGFLVGGRSCW